MKKLLFCAGLLVLAASCSDDKLDSFSEQNENTKGIVFGATIADIPSTRGEISTAGSNHNFVWHAEKDRIDVWATGATSSINNDYSVYKATKNMVNGLFAGVNDDNILEFDGSEKATFFAIYPSANPAGAASTLHANIESYNVPNTQFTYKDLPLLTDQTQASYIGDPDFNKRIVAFSFSEVDVKNTIGKYDGVGENSKLEFTRAGTAAVFATKGFDRYTKEGATSTFGLLKSIKMESKGSWKDGVLNTANATKLNYGSQAKLEFDGREADITKKIKITPYLSDAENFVELKLGASGAGLAWEDSKTAYMAISNIDRSAYQTTNPAEPLYNAKDSIEITFNFEHISLVRRGVGVTNKNWPATIHSFVGFTGDYAINLAHYNYLVTNGDNQGLNRTLIVNGGKFSDIFDASGDVIWEAAPGGLVPVDNFNKIEINNITLTDDEMKMLNAFTNVESLYIEKNTALKAGNITALDKLTYLEMPALTSIEETGVFNTALENGKTTGLKTVILPKYNFENKEINTQFLNEKTLEVLNMAGVTKTNFGFPAEGITLSGFTQLREVTVTNGILLGGSTFKGCTSLSKVLEHGLLNTAARVKLNGTHVFQGCGNLMGVHVMNKEIPEYSFDGCTNLNSATGPTGSYFQALEKVENYAFSGCKNITTIDLTNCTTLGTEAFKDCIKLVGSYSAPLVVGATSISFSAFNGCTALEYVHFTAATEIYPGILGATTKLKEVKFDKPFGFVEGQTYGNLVFGPNAINVELFVAEGQKYYDGKILTLLGGKTIEFKAITIPKVYQ